MNEVIIPGWKGWTSSSGYITYEMVIWIHENIKEKYQIYAKNEKGTTVGFAIRFSGAEDAMAFKLRWS